MVPFNLETELAGKVLKVSAEQLDQIGDEDGYIRYDVTEGTRRAVVYVNVEDQTWPLATGQDAESYFESLHYPEHFPAFCTGDDFDPEEVQIIANAIRQHDHRLRPLSDKFTNPSIFPDL